MIGEFWRENLGLNCQIRVDAAIEVGDDAYFFSGEQNLNLARDRLIFRVGRFSTTRRWRCEQTAIAGSRVEVNF